MIKNVFFYCTIKNTSTLKSLKKKTELEIGWMLYVLVNIFSQIDLLLSVDRSLTSLKASHLEPFYAFDEQRRRYPHKLLLLFQWQLFNTMKKLRKKKVRIPMWLKSKNDEINRKHRTVLWTLWDPFRCCKRWQQYGLKMWS